MKKVVITCGLIAGIIGVAFMTIGMSYFERNQTGTTEIVGYTSLLVSGSLIFVGIKMFRDKYNGGLLSFGKAFLVGLYITLIASTIFVIAWALEYKFLFPDFLDKYSQVMIAKTRTSEASPEKIAAQLKQLASYRDMYKNPIFFTLFTYAEYLPGGVIISLIAALILKKGNSKTPTAAN